jgi:hypothetical protein
MLKSSNSQRGSQTPQYLEFGPQRPYGNSHHGSHSGLTKDVIDVGRVIGRLNALSEIHIANFAKRLDIWKGCAEARLGGLNH